MGWFFDRAPYPDGVPTIGDEMALEARPAAVTRRDYSGALGTVEVDVTVPSYGVDVIDGQAVVRISGRDHGGSGDE